MRFKVVLEWDEETGVYVATVPALPGCATQGKTREEALERVKEAIAVTVEGLKTTGQPVPSGDVDISIAEVVIPAGPSGRVSSAKRRGHWLP
ncbi:MAG: type II toxin-antitoxin system HicB family antitoxin [Thermanaeromonas sp.]|uniref:type II toxin-antitoxin system HicB family antitoxin n=1 Tax=Thermanaeromonas sp. TaxID=2003697 RepID=UPI002439874F|nr:type II toxin-antitoxin system HicB family antitoxin [Thermanaeromonas sp.]MCG0278527.1 type II toxin-antitoxin system HicB family antitoxin [Thermanaeromonas sp.]